MTKTLIDTTTGGVSWGTGDYYTEIMQDMFLPVMADTVIYPNARLKRLPTNKTRIRGKGVVFPVHTDDANGVVAIGAGGTLPEPDTEKFDQYSFNVRHIYGRMKFDGITADANEGAIAAWLDIVMNEVQTKAKLMARQRQRMYVGDGSGILARVTAGGGGTTLTLGVSPLLTGYATMTDTAPNRWFKVGQLIAAIDPGSMAVGGNPRGLYRVASKIGTTQITVTLLAGAVSNSDYLVSLNVPGTAVGDAVIGKDVGLRIEPMGMRGIVSDANPLHDTYFQGIDRATYAFNQAHVKSNGGVQRPITIELLDECVLHLVEQADSVPTVIFGDFKQIRKVSALILPERRFNTTGSTIDAELGVGDVSIHGVPFVADRDEYSNSLVFVDETDLKLYPMKELTWMDKDGSIYQRILDKDEYQATFYMRETMGCDTPDHHLLLTDLL